MSKDNTEAAFYKFDVDNTPDLAQELGIQAMPTFLFFKNGEEVKKIIGGDKKKIDEAVMELKA
jgi:thioredoxin 1